jgi:hypothetical protein
LAGADLFYNFAVFAWLVLICYERTVLLTGWWLVLI